MSFPVGYSNYSTPGINPNAPHPASYQGPGFRPQIQQQPQFTLQQYQVRPGDSFEGIAQMAGISPQILAQANPELQQYGFRLQPGMVIRVPVPTRQKQAPVDGYTRSQGPAPAPQAQTRRPSRFATFMQGWLERRGEALQTGQKRNWWQRTIDWVSDRYVRYETGQTPDTGQKRGWVGKIADWFVDRGRVYAGKQEPATKGKWYTRVADWAISAYQGWRGGNSQSTGSEGTTNRSGGGFWGNLASTVVSWFGRKS